MGRNRIWPALFAMHVAMHVAMAVLAIASSAHAYIFEYDYEYPIYENQSSCPAYPEYFNPITCLPRTSSITKGQKYYCGDISPDGVRFFVRQICYQKNYTFYLPDAGALNEYYQSLRSFFFGSSTITGNDRRYRRKFTAATGPRGLFPKQEDYGDILIFDGLSVYTDGLTIDISITPQQDETEIPVYFYFPDTPPQGHILIANAQNTKYYRALPTSGLGAGSLYTNSIPLSDLTDEGDGSFSGHFSIVTDLPTDSALVGFGAFEPEAAPGAPATINGLTFFTTGASTDTNWSYADDALTSPNLANLAVGDSANLYTRVEGPTNVFMLFDNNTENSLNIYVDNKLVVELDGSHDSYQRCHDFSLGAGAHTIEFELLKTKIMSSSSDNEARIQLLQLYANDSPPSPPSATFVTTPPPTSSSTSATFEIALSGSAARYRYKLDNGAFSEPIYGDSPTITRDNLANGPHSLTIITGDDCGRWQSESAGTTYTWTIMAPPERTHFTGQPNLFASATTTDIRITGEGVTHYKYSLDGVTWSEETSITTPLRLENLSNGAHTLHLVSRNAEGVWQTVPTTYSWTVAALAPDYLPPDTGATICRVASGEIACPAPGETASQDASYQGQPPSYLDNGDATVRDLVTGLTWQQGWHYGSFSEVGEYCASLTLGDRDDWRLPTQRELLSIVELEHYAALNPVFGDNNYMFWSASSGQAASGNAWYVDLQYGLSMSYPANTELQVRCVRGGPIPSSVFIDNLDGSVSDQTTGLMWEKQTSATAMSWENALRHCLDQTTAGHSDWRLPNKRELETLLDFDATETLTNPSFDMNPELGGGYWSSTPLTAAAAMSLDATTGAGDDAAFSSAFQARCVRDGGKSPVAVVTGAPTAATAATTVTLTVGGAGVTGYLWRLDDDPYGEVRPVTEKIVLSGLSEGQHAVAARGCAGDVCQQASRATTVTWTVDLTAPSTPAIPPARNPSTQRTPRPQLNWTPSPDGSSYILEISNKADFSTPILSTVVTGSSYTLGEGESLPSGGRWYWRIRARDEAGNLGAWVTAMFAYTPASGASPMLLLLK